MTFPQPAFFISKSILIPPCRGVTITSPEANEILVVEDIGRDDIHCAIGHILFLIQNGRRIRTTFNTMDGYRIRVEEGDIHLGESSIIY
jgi:hypothetical protein